MSAFRNGTFLALGALSLALTRPAFSEETRRPNALVGRSYVFPSSANVAGQFGAYFKTKMTIYNPNAQAITVNAFLSTPAGASQTASLVMPANSFSRWENFLDEKFGYAGGAGINLQESTLTRSFVAVAEVYTESANGRYSTPLSGLFTDDAVVALGNPLASPISVVATLRVDSSNRANFGCSSASAAPTQIRADFFAFSNFVRTGIMSASLDLGPFGWAQQAVPVEGDDIIAYFWLVSGSPDADVYCYGVNVNNASNDGTAIPARTWSPLN